MKTIKIPKNTQIAIIGDSHEHSEHFFSIIDKIQPSEKMWFISVGDFEGKGFGKIALNSMINKMIELHKNNCGFMVKGNHEIKWLKNNKKNTPYSAQYEFIKNLPLSLSFEFYNGAKVTVVHAGINPKMTWDELDTNIEVCYIRDLDSNMNMIPLIWKDINGIRTLVKAKEGGIPWAEIYDGRFGYVCAGHEPNRDGKPKYYNYSCNLDCAVFETGILSAQIFTAEGKLGELITVSGTPFKPELNEKF